MSQASSLTPATTPATTPMPTMTMETYMLKAQLILAAAIMTANDMEGRTAPEDPTLGANATNPNASPAQQQASQAYLTFLTETRDIHSKWYEYLAQATVDETVFPHPNLLLSANPSGAGSATPLSLSPVSLAAALAKLTPAQLQPFAAALAPLLQIAGQVAAQAAATTPQISLGSAVAAGS